MTEKRALVTGITGQDGSYLAELLLAKNYSVIGVTSGRSNRDKLKAIEEKIEWEVGDVTDEAFVRSLIEKYKPDEVYNLASVATVAAPWDDVPELARVVAMTPIYLLEAMKQCSPATKLFQASSSQMFGIPESSPQNEETALLPRNPYGYAKAYAHGMLQAYRRDQNLFAVSGILFNHESPRRSEAFVTRKITSSLARIKSGTLDAFTLGNLDAKRDWGFAGDYMEAAWLMLQQEKPDDFVIASGEAHTVREFVIEAAKALDMKISFAGSGLEELAKDEHGNTILSVNPVFYRPEGETVICGDISHAQERLGWSPRTSFEALVSMMARADTSSLKRPDA